MPSACAFVHAQNLYRKREIEDSADSLSDLRQALRELAQGIAIQPRHTHCLRDSDGGARAFARHVTHLVKEFTRATFT